MTSRFGSTPQLKDKDLPLDPEHLSQEGSAEEQSRMVSGFAPVKPALPDEENSSENAESGARPIPRLVYPALVKKEDVASDFVALLESTTEAPNSSAPVSAGKSAESGRISRALWVAVVLLGSAALGAFFGFAYRGMQQRASVAVEIELPVMMVSQPAPKLPQREEEVAVAEPEDHVVAEPAQVVVEPSSESVAAAAPAEPAAVEIAAMSVAQSRRWRPLSQNEQSARSTVAAAASAPEAAPAAVAIQEVAATAPGAVAVEVAKPVVPDVKLPETLSREAVKAGFEALRPALTACANGKSGVAEVVATVATSGRVTHAVVSGVFTGTAGSCMARAIRGARFESFSNGPLMVEFPYAL